MNLEDYLHQNARCYPDKVAVVCGDTSLTYAQLWQEVARRAQDFHPHEVVCFRSSQDIDFLVTSSIPFLINYMQGLSTLEQLVAFYGVLFFLYEKPELEKFPYYSQFLFVFFHDNNVK